VDWKKENAWLHSGTEHINYVNKLTVVARTKTICDSSVSLRRWVKNVTFDAWNALSRKSVGPTLCVSRECSATTVEPNLYASHNPPSSTVLSVACCCVVTYLSSAAAVQNCWTELIQYTPADRVFVVAKANNHVFSVLLHYNLLSLVWQASRVSETELTQLGIAFRAACKNAAHSF
jgi:hypothetical protein